MNTIELGTVSFAGRVDDLAAIAHWWDGSAGERLATGDEIKLFVADAVAVAINRARDDLARVRSQREREDGQP